MGAGAGAPIGAGADCRCRGAAGKQADIRQRGAGRCGVEPLVAARKSGPAARSARRGRPSQAAGQGQRKTQRCVALGRLTTAQQELVTRNIGLVGLHLRNRVPTPRQPTRLRERADLFQVGCMALIRAARRYDPALHGSFSAYALPRIRGAIFTAVHEHFATIRVPREVIVRRRRQLALDGRSSIPRPPIVHQWRDEAHLAARLKTAADPHESTEPTIRALARRRLERAVQAALEDLQSRKWRRRNACEVMTRIAAERILVAHTDQRTPTRELSRLLGISSGRISEYEHLLLDTVKQRLGRDAQVSLLLQFAREDPEGMDGPITSDRREQLLLADTKAFDLQLEAMDRSKRAELLYRLVEQSGEKPDDLIRKLYRAAIEKDRDIAI